MPVMSPNVRLSATVALAALIAALPVVGRLDPSGALTLSAAVARAQDLPPGGEPPDGFPGDGGGIPGDSGVPPEGGGEIPDGGGVPDDGGMPGDGGGVSEGGGYIPDLSGSNGGNSGDGGSEGSGGKGDGTTSVLGNGGSSRDDSNTTATGGQTGTSTQDEAVEFAQSLPCNTACAATVATNGDVTVTTTTTTPSGVPLDITVALSGTTVDLVVASDTGAELNATVTHDTRASAQNTVKVLVGGSSTSTGASLPVVLDKPFTTNRTVHQSRVPAARTTINLNGQAVGLSSFQTGFTRDLARAFGISNDRLTVNMVTPG